MQCSEQKIEHFGRHVKQPLYECSRSKGLKNGMKNIDLEHLFEITYCAFRLLKKTIKKKVVLNGFFPCNNHITMFNAITQNCHEISQFNN